MTVPTCTDSILVCFLHPHFQWNSLQEAGKVFSPVRSMLARNSFGLGNPIKSTLDYSLQTFCHIKQTE